MSQHEDPLATVLEGPFSYSRSDSPYYLTGNPSEVVADGDLPWTRHRIPPEEEDLDSVQTVEAWVVDIPDPRHITSMLKWLKQASLDTPDLTHLKRIRKLNGEATLLLATLITSPSPPLPPSGLDLPAPYRVLVPCNPALTSVSLGLKSTFWPTLYTPSRKGDVEDWTYGKVKWAWEAMQVAIVAAREARKKGELPIAAHVAAPYAQDLERTDYTFAHSTYTAWDSRQSNSHALRHAVMNVIRQVADDRGSRHSPAVSAEGLSLRSSSPLQPPPPEDGKSSQSDLKLSNGTNYLLTSLTLFTTHEPCIMCSMALTHSRVKEVFYMYPMSKTGGCGGAACLPTLKGVNHRFGICQWRMDPNVDNNIFHTNVKHSDLYIDDVIDA